MTSTENGTVPVPPIIVFDRSGDADLFRSVDLAERFIEPIDVRAGEYVAFDRNARLLSLATSSFRRKYILFGSAEVECVRVSLSDEMGRSEELEQRLTSALEQTKSKFGPVSSGSLCELLLEAVVRLGIQ